MILSNGVVIPDMGFGTYKMAPEDTRASVLCALQSGWRHVDTAAFYQNEAEVGQAVRESGLPREELFITTPPCVLSTVRWRPSGLTTSTFTSSTGRLLPSSGTIGSSLTPTAGGRSNACTARRE